MQNAIFFENTNQVNPVDIDYELIKNSMILHRLYTASILRAHHIVLRLALGVICNTVYTCGRYVVKRVKAWYITFVSMDR